MTLRGNRPASPRRRALLAGAGALAATAALTGCQRAEAPVDEEGRVRLRFATDWRAQAEHGGFYQALASGAYARRGLNVEIIQGG
ncbi:MAG: ABC transporter substrate-binding protein, partial [bacterium]